MSREGDSGEDPGSRCGRRRGMSIGRSWEGRGAAARVQRLRPRPVRPEPLLPARPRIPRPRAAQRPSSARRSPGEGPGIAAAGEAQEARGARVTSWARGRRGGWSVGEAELRPGIGLNVGNLVSKEGAAAEAAGGGRRACAGLPALAKARSERPSESTRRSARSLGAFWGRPRFSRFIPGRDAEVGGCWVALPKPPPTRVWMLGIRAGLQAPPLSLAPPSSAPLRAEIDLETRRGLGDRCLEGGDASFHESFSF